MILKLNFIKISRKKLYNNLKVHNLLTPLINNSKNLNLIAKIDRLGKFRSLLQPIVKTRKLTHPN